MIDVHQLRTILLQKAEYWRNKTDDPHGISRAVEVALLETESALSQLEKETEPEQSALAQEAEKQ